jgi:hypothetical protein
MLMSIGCFDDSSSVGARNDFSRTACVPFKCSGSTFNINEVAGRTASPSRDVSEGEHTATAAIQSESAAPFATFNARNNNKYTIVFTNTTLRGVRVDVEEK